MVLVVVAAAAAGSKRQAAVRARGWRQIAPIHLNLNLNGNVFYLGISTRHSTFLAFELSSNSTYIGISTSFLLSRI